MTQKAVVTAIIPIKGHSERVPSKNTRPLGGVPLCCHILTTLSTVPAVGSIIVDTDAANIKDLILRQFPAVRVIDRPAAICGDSVSPNAIIANALAYVDTTHFLQTHVTNPFLGAETIDHAVDWYLQGLTEGFDSAVGVNAYHTRFYDAKGKPVNHDPDTFIPSQHMPCIYEDNSNFYITSVETFRRYNRRVGNTPLLIPVPKLESLDIDEEDDFLLAEALYRHLTTQQKG